MSSLARSEHSLPFASIFSSRGTDVILKNKAKLINDSQSPQKGQERTIKFYEYSCPVLDMYREGVETEAEIRNEP